MNRFLFFLFVAFLSFQSNAQDSIPVLKGTANISISKGTIVCDFSLSNLPRINDYVLRLNAGMNIRNFRNEEKGNLIYYDIDRADTMSSGESLGYYFPGQNNKGKFLPNAVHFRYGGMFPVIGDSAKERSVQDWRGNIAFNGYSLRMDGLQSAWYPVLYDMKRQRRYDKVKYDITINCEDCKTIYVNGQKPVQGTSAHFISDKPGELFLYCGRFETASVGGTYILNPDFGAAQQGQFLKQVNALKTYYAAKLGVPFNGNVTFIQTTPTADNYGFLFVAYPTIINVGAGENGLKFFFSQQDGGYAKSYIAHELGHYYFSNTLALNTHFGPVINEGFTEYIAWKAVQAVFQDSTYLKTVERKVKALSGFQPLSFSQIKTADDFRNRELYVYYYTPVLLSAIEKEIGEKAMWQWLHTMLTSSPEFTDYSFLLQTLSSVVADNSKLQMIKTKYFESPESLKNALATSGLK